MLLLLFLNSMLLLLRPKTIHESGILQKKKAMSPCFIHARNKHKQGEIAFFFFSRMFDSCIVLGCNSKSAQLPYFEKVQHPEEKPRAKSFFAKVIRAVAKVYLCEKNLGGYWHFNSIVMFH